MKVIKKILNIMKLLLFNNKFTLKSIYFYLKKIKYKVLLIKEKNNNK